MRIVFKVALLAALVASAASAADWPGFQGLHQNGISPETGLLKTWPQDGPPTAWTVDVGPGFGGVAIKAGRVYLLDREKETRDIVRCFDLDTGDEIWQFSYDAPGRISYPGSRSHPAVDDERVYVLGPFGDLHALDLKTHRPVWKKNILKEYDGREPNWKVAQAPVLYKGHVIVAPVGAKAGMVALDAATGDEVWASPPLKGKMTYATPMLTPIGGVDQFALITSIGVEGVDANSGALLWAYEDWTCDIPCSSAFPIGDGRILVTGGYNAGSAMFRVTKAGDGFTAETVYKTEALNCQIHQPILYQNHLYLNGNDKSKRYGLVCMTLDGKILWETGRNPGFDWGGLLLADGRIYTVDGDKGDLVMVDPSPEGYKELGRAKYLSGDQIWGTVALSEGRIIIRDQKQMKCVDLRAQ